MREANFKKMLHGLARRLSIDPTLLAADDAAELTEYLNQGAAAAWKFHPWPETIYYQKYTHSSYTIAYSAIVDQDALGSVLPEAGEILGIFCIDPRTAERPQPLRFRTAQDKIHILNRTNVPAQPWVAWRLPAPEFTSTALVTTDTYDGGDLVYDATSGNVYLCVDNNTAGTVALTDTNSWEQVLLPQRLSEAVKVIAHGAHLASEGQFGKADALFAQADALMEQDVVITTERERQSSVVLPIPAPTV